MSGTYTGYGPNQGSIDPSRNGPPGQHNPNQQYSRPGFDRRGNDRRSGNQSRSDSGRNEASVGNQARMKPEYSAGARQGSSSSHGGGAWNNQQVYPNRDSGPRSNPPRNRPEEGMRPIEGAADHSKVSLDNVDGAGNNQQLRRNAGPRSNPPRNRPEEGMRPIEGAADHSKVSLDNVDGAGNNQQLRRNAGPRPAPQGSRSKDGSWPTQNRPNQGHADHSRNSYGNAEGISAKPNSEYPEVVKVMKKDLFDMPEEYSLAHCVGSDLIMSSGVAVNFRKKFRQVPELLEQNKQPGEVAFLESKGRFIYYLVTKVASTGKPTWDDFERAVIEWSRLCVEHKVTKVAIPKLGCGRDQLDWNRVRDLINRQFSAHEIEVVVCVIDQEAVPEKKWNLKLNHSKEPLSMLDPRDCALVFIASKDHFLTPSIQRLATKYGFTSDYSSGQLGLGSLYQYTNAVTKVAIFGLVVKLKHSDPISFSSVGTCLQHLRRAVKKMKLYYMGFEAFDDPKFPNVTRKLWTAVIDTFFVEEIEVYFCWPNDVKEKNWEERMLH